MTSNQILTLARKHLDAHGFSHIPVRMTSSRRALGQAIFPRSNGEAVEVRLSSVALPHMPSEDVEDVILHEIAHLIAGLKAGHNEAWKAACRMVGARPERLYEGTPELAAKVSKYEMACTKCENKNYFNRRLKHHHSNYRCGICGGEFSAPRTLR